MARIKDLGITAVPGTRGHAIPWLACETCIDESNVTCPDPSKVDDDDDDDKGKKHDDHKTKYFTDAAVAQLKAQLREQSSPNA